MTIHPAYRVLGWLSMLAVITVTASTEFGLARDVLALHPALCVAVPIAIDSYVVASLATRRDVVPALAVMGASLLAAMGAHMALAAGALDPRVRALTAATFMIVLVVVMYRVHVLVHPQHAASAPDSATASASGPARSASGRVQSSASPAASASAPVAVRERAPVKASAAIASSARPVAKAVDNTDDATIVRAILAQGNPAPSVRAIQATYRVGQTRAKRISEQVAREVLGDNDNQSQGQNQSEISSVGPIRNDEGKSTNNPHIVTTGVSTAPSRPEANPAAASNGHAVLTPERLRVLR